MTHTAVLLGDAEPRTDEWHALRANGIGASEIATVLGLSPWDSPFSLWHRKAGNVTDDYADSPSTYWGTIHEPAICDEWARRNPWADVRRCGTYAHPDETWMTANPDRLVYDEDDLVAVLEAKTARMSDGWGEDGSDEIPVTYRAQVMQQMHVMGVPVAHVAVLIGGSDFRTYTIDYDPTEATLLVDAGAAFWRSLAAGTPPPIDAAEATTRTLKRLHDTVEDVEVMVDADLADDYVDALAASKAADLAKSEVTNRMLAALGDARIALAPDGSKLATRSVSVPKRFDRKSFAADHPDLDAKYTVAGEPAVRLTPARIKETKS